MNISENFSKAIEKVMARYNDRTEIEITEIWIDTSLPKDLIVELIKEGKVKIPEGIDVVKHGKRIIWRRG